MVRQCPCGHFARNRWPRGARPCKRVMFVLAADSSRKTSRAGSQPRWRRTHRRRNRARSGRSCSAARSVFFIGQAQRGQGVMDRWQRAVQAQRLPQFAQGAVRLLGDQPPQALTVLFAQARLAPAAVVLGAVAPLRRRCCNSFLTKPSDTRNRQATSARGPSSASYAARMRSRKSNEVVFISQTVAASLPNGYTIFENALKHRATEDGLHGSLHFISEPKAQHLTFNAQRSSLKSRRIFAQ